MLNQAAIEALYSASYIENYLDYVENLPDELQRYVSRVRELDLTFDGFLKDVEQQRDALLMEVESSAKKKNYLSKVQQALICAQELGDEKLQILQQVQDIIENKTRQLDLDYKNLDIGKDQEIPETGKETTAREGSCVPLAGINNGSSGGERQSKRVRRTRTDAGTPSDLPAGPEVAVTPDPVRQVQQTPQQTTPTNSVSSQTKKNANSATTIGKKKKRKSRQASQTQGQQSAQTASQREDSPPRDEEMAIDPDEPTYCLCDQISYGEMIMCDNDLCPYEWFHFSCVSLGVKPKGKWYCPKCRGDRSSVMKPKAQFMKELERIKQEKELKEEKGS